MIGAKEVLRRDLTRGEINYFKKNGYLILEDFLLHEEISILRQEADGLVSGYSTNQSLVRNTGCILEPDPSRTCHPIHYSLINTTLYRIAFQLFGRNETVSFLNEQYIVKPPACGKESGFIWHQDNQYLPREEQFCSCIAAWCALDDVHEENGTLQILPFSESNADLDDSENDCVAYHWKHCREKYPPLEEIVKRQDDEDWNGTIVSAGAGTVVLMSGHVYHRGLPNMSETEWRRVYMPQYSCRQVLLKTSRNHG